MPSVIRYIVIAIALTMVAVSHAQTKTLLKGISDNAVTESFSIKSGTTLTISSGATINAASGSTITGLATPTDLTNGLALKAPIASPTFTGTVTIPAGASISGYLTSATAATTYQPLDADLTSIAGLTTTGNPLKVIRVNAAATAYELATVSGGGGSGDVVGPASSTDNALARFDLTTGKLLQNSTSTLSDVGLASFDALQFSTAPTSTVGYGRAVWDTTDSCLSVGLNASVNALVGTDSHVQVYNDSASTMNVMQVVRQSGSSGTRLKVALALANTDSNSATTIGVVAQTIASNAQGFIQTAGLLRGVNTNAFNEGDTLWLSAATAGLITNVKPTAPNHGVRIGYCIKKAGVGDGIILIDILNGFELDELHDVLITGTVADNSFLSYSTASSAWINEAPSAARTSLGLGTLATQNGTISDYLTTATAATTYLPLTGGTLTGPLFISANDGFQASLHPTSINFYDGSEFTTMLNPPSPISNDISLYFPASSGTLALLSDVANPVLSSGGVITWNVVPSTSNLILRRAGPGSLQLGTNAASGTPIAQTLKGPDGTAGQTNQAGGNLTLSSGLSTGSGAASVIIATSNNTAASTALNTAVTRLTANASGVTISGALTSPNAIFSGLSLAGSSATNTIDVSTVWNTTGSPALIYGRANNAASGSTAKILDLGTTASGSFISLSKTGLFKVGDSTGSAPGGDATIYCAPGSNQGFLLDGIASSQSLRYSYYGLGLWNGYRIGFSSSYSAVPTAFIGTGPTLVTGQLQMGDNAGTGTPVAQTFKGPDGTAGQTNQAGGNLTISSGRSTGSGAASVIIATSDNTAASTVLNTAVTRLTADASGVTIASALTVGTTLTASAATGFVGDIRLEKNSAGGSSVKSVSGILALTGPGDYGNVAIGTAGGSQVFFPLYGYPQVRLGGSYGWSTATGNAGTTLGTRLVSNRLNQIELGTHHASTWASQIISSAGGIVDTTVNASPNNNLTLTNSISTGTGSSTGKVIIGTYGSNGTSGSAIGTLTERMSVSQSGVAIGVRGSPISALSTVVKAAFNPASIAAGATETTTATITGAVAGSTYIATPSTWQGLIISADRTGTDTVTITLYNPTITAIDAAATDIRVTEIAF